MKIGRKNSPLLRFEDFEKNVLGNCIKNVSLIDKYLISSEDFYEARDQVIFKGILTMKMKGLLTGDLELRQYLKEANLIEKVSGGFLYIGSLTDNAIEHNIGHQVKKLKEASRQRELWKLGHRLSQTIEKGFNQAEIDNITEQIYKSRRRDSIDDISLTIKPSMHPAMDLIDNKLVYGIPNGKQPVFIRDREILQLCDVSPVKNLDNYPEQPKFSQEAIKRYLNGDNVDPLIIYERIRDLLLRYIIFQHQWQVDLTVVWIIGTYVYRCFPLYPYYWIKSPTKRCGKTRLLELMSALCFNAEGVETAPTEAVLFRLPSITGGALPWDEAENLFNQRDKGDLISILNTAYRKEGIVRRCEGKDHRIKTYGVYRPIALAGISSLPDTVADRSLKMELIRKRGDEKVGRLQIGRLDSQLQEIRDELHIFALDNAHHILEAYNEFEDDLIPSGADDRLRDAFEVMMSVVSPILYSHAHHHVLTQLQKAVRELSGIRNFDEEDSYFIRAVNILKSELDQINDDKLILASEEAVELFQDGGIGWIKEPKDASSILRKFKIRSEPHRIGNTVKRGYKITKSMIDDLYSRYGGAYSDGKSVQSVTN